jgi:Bacterial PH domain
MSEHEFEAVRGLPGDLPEGETVLWQGAPDWWLLALDAFKLRWVMGYFIGLTAWRFGDGVMNGAEPVSAMTTAIAVFPLAVVAIAIFCALAWINSRSTVYTITTKRIVMRFGAALTKAINIPFKIIESASSNVKPNGHGIVAVKLVLPNKIPVLLLWPHKKPGTIRHPEPAFRCIKDADKCAPILAEALRVAHAQTHAVVPTTETSQSAPQGNTDTQPALA